ncbi:MAG: hypothetical protein WCF84_18750 [Anaerolineae bacterium]
MKHQGDIDAAVEAAVKAEQKKHAQFHRQANRTIARIEKKLAKLEKTGYPVHDRLEALKAFVEPYAKCNYCGRTSGHDRGCPYRRDDGSAYYQTMRAARMALGTWPIGKAREAKWPCGICGSGTRFETEKKLAEHISSAHGMKYISPTQ